MTERIDVVLVDDHCIVRSGVRMLLESSDDIAVVAEAGSAEDGIAAVLAHRPDVTVMDIGLPDLDGVTATRRVLDTWPEARILALTMHGEDGFLVPFLEAGGMGYLSKSAVDRQLEQAVRRVAAGDFSVQPAGLHAFVSRHRPPTGPPPEDLSSREREVLELTARGFTSREIGERLCISSRTVETYRARIMEKLHFTHRSDFVDYALECGLLGGEYTVDGTRRP